MGARWVWALVAALAAGTAAVAVVAVVDDGPGPADAQATTTTTTTVAGGSGGGSGTNGPLRTVTVTAEGTASGTPDTAIVQLGVQTQASTADKALEQANQKASQLLDALKFGGVKPEDITTTNVFVYPMYVDGQKITGYQAGNSVSAKIRDVSKAGTIIDAAAGVVGDEITLQGVYFNVDDTGPLKQAARDDAVGHAKAQADQLAAATGLKVGKVVSIVEGSVPSIPVVYAADAGTPATTLAGSTPVPLQPGQQELNLSVTVVYELTA